VRQIFLRKEEYWLVKGHYLNATAGTTGTVREHGHDNGS
jgi:hypothetical protein